MAYTVSWDQWFRCGPAGDDSDFEEMNVEFDSKEKADDFIADLVSGKFKGTYDRTVKPEDISIDFFDQA